MPLSLTSLFLGFVIGVVSTAIAMSLMHRTVRNPETSKVTGVWSVRDVMEPGTRPAVIAERIDGLQLPPGTKVVVPQGQLHTVPQDVLQTCEVRMHPDVRLNAAIGRDRALLFSGHIHPRAHAVVTMDGNTVRRLQNDFQRMWGESTPYVESVTVSELAGKDGRLVDVTGRATEVMEYRGRKMLRITDGKVAVGVVTRQDDVVQHQGRTIRVVGRMHRDGGYAYIEADRVAAVEQGAAVPA